MTLSSRNLLCASILPRRQEELQLLVAACAEADMIELRLDLLPDVDVRAVRILCERPCIATVRSQAEGGLGTLSDDETATVLQHAIDASVEYIDVEYTRAQTLLPQLHLSSTQLVLSHHTTERALPALRDLARAMLTVEADVYKLVFTATHPDDALTAQELHHIFRAAGKRYIVHAMGKEGSLSRLLGAIHGNAWTYVATSETTVTAPGQLTLRDAYDYDIPHKQQNAAVLGLLGWPTRYSKGRFLHNTLLRRSFPNKPIPFLYVNFPTQDVPSFWQTWQNQLAGLSITLPHKECIVAHLDELSDEVQMSCICNTAVRWNGRWYGYNTDMMALHTLLEPHRSRLAEGTIVAGTGGTARSAVAVLRALGITNIFCTGRNEERGRQIAERFGITFLPENQCKKATFVAVIHTTPVGMAPQVETLPAIATVLQPGMLVLDAVYNPPLTRLLSVARELGCTTISGVEMFLAQAAEQFRLFTGIAVGSEEVREVWEEIMREEERRKTE